MLKIPPPKRNTLLDYSAGWWTSDTFRTNFAAQGPTGQLYRTFHKDRQCPYCKTKTLKVFDACLPTGDNDPGEFRIVDIWACLNCGWWYDKFAIIDFFFAGWERLRRRVRYLRQFSIDSESLPLETLSRELLGHPKVIHAINPKRLEALAAAVLADFFEAEVTVIGRSGDGGIDLVYVDTETPFAIQVKRRERSGHREGVSLVREFLGACLLAGHKNACILTTAEGFTKGAHSAAEDAVRMKLVNSFDLIARDRFLGLFRYTHLANIYPWTETAHHWMDLWKEHPDASFECQRDFLR